MKILITGCRGFIGSSFGHYAHAAGHDILGVSRSSQAPHRWPGHYAASDVATFNLTEMIERFQPELVFHAAGSASVSRSLIRRSSSDRASL
ncbi:MAG: NAD-dependent epimerase/dehydratase family protein [Verrucomicrobia bacterium]|nr:NAD-dependent epimerase/dehydratase family protein [Verrucomicrobiota bacterium]